MPASWRDFLTQDEAREVKALDDATYAIRQQSVVVSSQLQVYRARAGMRSAYLKRKVLDTPAQLADT